MELHEYEEVGWENAPEHKTTPMNKSNLRHMDSGISNAYVDIQELNRTKTSENPTFTEAASRANIASRESFATILGKIKKYFTDLKAVAFSGSYNDLSNKPTIPTVNNATLTIQKNGTTVKTFTANASSNVTANITVPTAGADIVVQSGKTATIENVLKRSVYNKGKDTTYTTLLAYINDLISSVNVATLSFQAAGFDDLPTTDWGYDVTVFVAGSVWVIVNKQQSPSEAYIRNINANQQWVTGWMRLIVGNEAKEVTLLASADPQKMIAVINGVAGKKPIVTVANSPVTNGPYSIDTYQFSPTAWYIEANGYGNFTSNTTIKVNYIFA